MIAYTPSLPLLPAPKVAGLLPAMALRIVPVPKMTQTKKQQPSGERIWVSFGGVCAELQPGQDIGRVLQTVVELGKGA